MKKAAVTQNRRKPAVTRPVEQGLLWKVISHIGEWTLAVILLVTIAACAFFAYKRITQNAFLPLKRVVVVQPLIYADPSTITNVVKKYGNIDLLHINVSELSKRISDLGWVKSATVKKKWPDAIEVSVVERVPVLRWGENQYLDNEGVAFHDPSSPSLQKLFLVKGPEGMEQEVLTMYRAVRPWLKTQGIAATGLILDPRLVWHVTLSPGIDVTLGRDKLNDRLRKLVLVNQRIIHQYAPYIEAIDLRYQDGFSVHWQPGVTPEESKDAGKSTKK